MEIRICENPTHLGEQDVDWSKVEMFHLDEYVDFPFTRVANFR